MFGIKKNIMGKPTITRFILGLTEEKLQEEYNLIKEKKSSLSRQTRDKIVIYVEEVLPTMKEIKEEEE